MKRNGFTLVELLAVVAIMGILALIVVPNVSKVRDDILAKDLVAIRSQISTAAKDWAYDNLNLLPTTKDATNNNYTVCRYVTIDELIVLGYLSGDKENKTVLQNPVTSESMNDLEVCIRYNISEGYSNRIMEAVVPE